MTSLLPCSLDEAQRSAQQNSSVTFSKLALLF